MAKFNPFDRTKADGTGRSKAESVPGRRLMCKLEKAEVEGLIMAKKRGAYMEWAYAICAKYNLTRTNFIVDEDTCELFYLN